MHLRIKIHKRHIKARKKLDRTAFRYEIECMFGNGGEGVVRQRNVKNSQ